MDDLYILAHVEQATGGLHYRGSGNEWVELFEMSLPLVMQVGRMNF